MDKLMRLVVAMQLGITQAVERKDRGATATEYALLVTFIAIAIVIAVTAFGTALSNFFDRIGNTVGTWA